MSERMKICARNEYQKDGETKTAWPVVGYLIDNGDKKYVTLNILPGQLFHIFPMDDPQQKPAAQSEGSSY